MVLPDDLIPEPTEQEVTTLYCDGEVKHVTFHRRRLGLRYYAMKMGLALRGIPIAKPDRDQHVMMVTNIEKTAGTDHVVRTIQSDLFTCEHA